MTNPSVSKTSSKPSSSLFPELTLLDSASSEPIPAGLVPSLAKDSRALVLWNESTAAVLGSVQTIEAERSDSTLLASIPEAHLKACTLVCRTTVEAGPHAEDVRGLLLYLALTRCRVAGRKILIASFDREAPEVARGRFAPIPGAPTMFATEVQYAAYQVFDSLSEGAKIWAAEKLLTQELEETVKRRCHEFLNNAFFKAVFDGTISKNQYIDSVANNHQFVRWTTRLLGRIVGVTSDPVLRRSYIEHLGGEIDHELLLENDLRHLGADVDWVRLGMVPNVSIHQFMCVQESMSAFHQDPLLFLAVPFAIEGCTAFMGEAFLEALKRCIQGWGIAKPSTACTFLASHIQFDGGDDGHWEGSRKMFQRFLRREHELQRVLNVVHMVMDAVDRAYESYVETPDLTGVSSAL